MDHAEIEALWRLAYRYFSRRCPGRAEYAGDFASIAVVKRLSGNRPEPLLWQLRKFMGHLGRETPIGGDAEDISNPEGQAEDADFHALYTLQERRALIRALDRHVVRPRSRLCERLAQGEDITPKDGVESEKAKQEHLKKRARELIAELRALERLET